MKQYFVLAGAAVCAVALSVGAVSAQTTEPVNADGSYVVATDDTEANVSGAGDDVIFGDVNTGGSQGETLGDPSAVYAPVLPVHPGPGGGLLVMPGSGDGLIGGVPIAPVYPTAPDSTTMTTTNLANNEGNTTENIPVEALLPTETAPVEADTGVASGGFCEQYGAWYDAQVAYENLGATAADPALVQEVDADYDGIACEGLMV